MSEVNLNKIKTRSSLQAGKKDGNSTSGGFSLFNRNKITDQIKLDAYKEMAILFASGIDVKNTIDLLIENLEKDYPKKVFTQIKEFIVKGKNLSDAFADTGMFTDYEIYSLKIGEETGNLDEVLNGLAFFYERRIKLKRIFVNAISYPGFLFLSTLAVVIFMLTFVVPMFQQMFSQFDAELPALTKVLIKISDLLVNQSLWIVTILAGLFLLLYNIRNTLPFRRITSGLVLKIPFVGELMRIIYVARFCQSMHLLIKSKTSIINALQLVKKMIGYYPIEITIDAMIKDIITGKTFSQAMATHSIFGKRMVSLLKVSEEVNKLDLIFNELSKQYTEEADYKTSIISTFLQPILLIIIGGIIGFIVVGMYLPMIELGGAAF